MSKSVEKIYIEVADNFAVKSIVFSDKSVIIKPPISNVDAVNPNSEALHKIRSSARFESEIHDVPLFYINHDLAQEVIRRKKLIGLLPKEN